MTAPRTVIQAEACQYPNDILPYFGKERKCKTTINNEEKVINKEQTEKVNENKNKPQTNNRRHNNNFHYRPKNKK